MKIRKAKKQDFEQYSSLRKEGVKYFSKLACQELKVFDKDIEEEFKLFLSDRKRVLLVVEENKEITGYINGMLKKKPGQLTSYICDIFIKKNSRGKGLGKKLVKEFIKWSKSKKAIAVSLGVRADNKKAVSFYKNLGFTVEHLEMDKRLL